MYIVVISSALKRDLNEEGIKCKGNGFLMAISENDAN